MIIYIFIFAKVTIKIYKANKYILFRKVIN
jgi:hypothetical protein